MRGSVVKRRKRYYAVVRPIDPHTGHTREIWRAAGTHREDADNLLEELRHQYAERGTIAHSGRLTLAEHLEDWLRAKELEGIGPETQRSYRIAVRGRIAPAIGGYPLSAITPSDVRRYLQSPAARNLMIPVAQSPMAPAGKRTYEPGDQPAAPRTVQLQYAVLREALQDAVDMELIARNPVAKIRMPRGDRQREPRRLTFKELAAFLDTAERVSPRYAALFRLAAVTGLRVGSTLALEWRDVRWDDATVEIRHGKTRASIQAMPIDTQTVGALRVHRKRQAEERLLAGPLWKNEGWIFANERGGRPRYRQVAEREMGRVVTAAGIGPVRMHDLRHTAGSRMLEAGIDPKTVADRLGHKDMAFFLKVYAGSLPSSHRAAADVMGERLQQARAGIKVVD